jgi:hypothetical protein
MDGIDGVLVPGALTFVAPFVTLIALAVKLCSLFITEEDEVCVLLFM